LVIRVKRLWATAAILLVLTALALGGYYYYIEEIRVIPEELVREALENTLTVSSYRYHVDVTLKLDGKEERTLSDVTGEKAKNNFHIQGKMLGQPVEVFQVDDINYSLHPKTGRWMVTPGTELFQPEIFMTEINPMANFRFTRVNNIQYHGVEKVGKKKLHVVSCNPAVSNNFMEKYWRDFSYRLWIDGHSKRVVKAQIYAKSIKDPRDTITIAVQLRDFNKKIIISAPKSD